MLCGGVAHSFCTTLGSLSKPKKHRQGCLMSTTQSLSSLKQVRTRMNIILWWGLPVMMIRASTQFIHCLHRKIKAVDYWLLARRCPQLHGSKLIDLS